MCNYDPGLFKNLPELLQQATKIIHHFLFSFPTKVELDMPSHINQNYNSCRYNLRRQPILISLHVGTRNILGWIGGSYQFACWYMYMQFGRLDEWPIPGFMITKLLPTKLTICFIEYLNL